jgi:hypothetical protein
MSKAPLGSPDAPVHATNTLWLFLLNYYLYVKIDCALSLWELIEIVVVL